jgi:methyl-accepting chemotaxis protein
MGLFILNRQSVQAKLNIVLILLVTVLLACFGEYDYLTMKKRITSELDDIAEAIAERLSNNMAVAIWEMYKESGIIVVESEMIEKRIYAIIVRENGREEPFIAMKREEDTWQTEEFDGNLEGDFIIRTKEVKKEDETLGSVHIFLTQKFMKDELRRSLYSLFFKILILDLILIAGMYLIFKRVVTGPFNQIVDRVRNIAEGEGDLTMRIESDSQDEIGDLAGLFNRFIGYLQKMIQSVFEKAETLNNASSNLSTLSNLMTEGSDQISSRANIVASASEEMSSSMDSVASSMEEFSTNIGIVAASIEEMTATINEIAGNSEKARNMTNEAVAEASNVSKRVDELGNAAQEIGKVTETITEISEQTNLLALNATIEAARAGAAGKGFAVVANEIKELARQTATATEEIKNQIEGIQTSTSGTVSDIGKILTIIDDVNGVVSFIATAVEEQSVTTKEIANNVAQASQGIQEINENVAQSNVATKDVTKEIADVNHATGEMSNNSSQVNLSAQELSRLSKDLRELVKQFKV